MGLKPSDIDYIIDLLTQVAEALTKTDFLTLQERQRLDLCLACERKIETINDVRMARYGGRLSEAEQQAIKAKYYYDPKVSQELKCKLSKAQTEQSRMVVEPLQKELDPYLTPRWPEILALGTQGHLKQVIEEYFLKQTINPVMNNTIISKKTEVIVELERIKAKLGYQNKKSAEAVGNVTLKSKIKDFLWTLYEKTLKVVVDAVMERWWPK